jgi:hypothetical protein
LTYYNFDPVAAGMIKTLKNKRNPFLEDFRQYGAFFIGATDNNLFFYHYNAVRKYGISIYRMWASPDKEIRYVKFYCAFGEIGDWLNPAGVKNNIVISSVGKTTRESMQIYQDLHEAYYSRSKSDKYGPLMSLPNSREQEGLAMFPQVTSITIAIRPALVGENFCIFNFEDDILYVLDKEMNLITASGIKDWKSGEILSNKEGNRCFLKYESNGFVTLKEIDIMTGKHLNTITLIKPKVEKIRIVGNTIYYTSVVEGVNAMERRLW